MIASSCGSPCDVMATAGASPMPGVLPLPGVGPGISVQLMERSDASGRQTAVKTTVNSLLILMLSLAACQAGAPTGGDGETGTLVIRPVYEPPPPDEPISIGGYGFFASVGDVEEQQIPFDGSLRVTLPAGTHALTIVTRAQSDVLMPDQDEPEFLEITAECQADVDVSAAGTVEVLYRATGGGTCEITTPDE